MRFRFDDVSINTDSDHLKNLTDVILAFDNQAEIILAVSPIVFHPTQMEKKERQRVHPQRLTAMSALSPYYKGQSAGLPLAVYNNYVNERRIKFAGHGIAHVDHRLLSTDAQEMSILMSTSLSGGRIFVPPYNKYNDDTIRICNTHAIELIRFEHGWAHVLHNEYGMFESPTRSTRWYLHPYDIKHPDDLRRWFAGGAL